MAEAVGLVEEAQRIADDVLFPRALETDADDTVPVDLLDVLAAAGLYGLVVPRPLGGLGADARTVGLVLEALAGGCLTTTFVWLQHNLTALSVSASEHPVQGMGIGDLAAGRRRAGVAFAHLRRPGPPAVTAVKDDGGWVLTGAAPWVTGWGRIDAVMVGARCADDIVWLMVDAVACETLTPSRLRLAAIDASATVEVRLAGHVVDDEAVVAIEPFAVWLARDASSLRTNGSLALGVASRCAWMLDSAAVHDRVSACRRALDDASPSDLPGARAEASALAVDVSAALVAAGGGRSIVRNNNAQRLAREALFLLVQGQTQEIRALQRLHFRA